MTTPGRATCARRSSVRRWASPSPRSDCCSGRGSKSCCWNWTRSLAGGRSSYSSSASRRRARIHHLEVSPNRDADTPRRQQVFAGEAIERRTRCEIELAFQTDRPPIHGAFHASDHPRAHPSGEAVVVRNECTDAHPHVGGKIGLVARREVEQ